MMFGPQLMLVEPLLKDIRAKVVSGENLKRNNGTFTFI
jgi:hypothetical protein